MKNLGNSIGGRVKLARLQLSHRDGARRIQQVRKSGDTFLDRGALVDLYDRVCAVELAQMPGILIEAGTARGGSALVMAAAKSSARPLYLYDTFGLIPPPSDGDGADAHARYDEIVEGKAQGVAGQGYYGYSADLLGSVQRLFAEGGIPVEANHVCLVQGLYEDTLRVNEPVALAHIDCDWYDSVLVCLERITPHLVEGGVLVIDDYDHWSGCRKAIDEFFADKRDQYRFERRSRLHVVKARA